MGASFVSEFSTISWATFLNVAMVCSCLFSLVFSFVRLISKALPLPESWLLMGLSEFVLSMPNLPGCFLITADLPGVVVMSLEVAVSWLLVTYLDSLPSLSAEAMS